MTERRRTPRQRTLKGGSIWYASAPTIDCVIRNLSAAGACLVFAKPMAVPNQFTLLIKPERMKRSCEVEWRSNKSVGVQFK
jgi:hypothetical protein